MPTVTAGAPTEAQLRVLDFIRRHRSRHGVSPTIREMQDSLGMASPNGVMCHLRALERKGLLRRHGFASARGFIPTDVGRPRCECCGQHLPAQEHETSTE